jgi:hypothetical protein
MPTGCNGPCNPALAKTGVSIDASGHQTTEAMTAADMIGWTRDGEGVANRPADFAYDITVADSYRQIATVTVHSAIYREYLHLVKTPDGWRILNALYTRSAPPASVRCPVCVVHVPVVGEVQAGHEPLPGALVGGVVALTARSTTGPLCPVASAPICAPLGVSQRRMAPSLPPVKNVVRSGLNAKL